MVEGQGKHSMEQTAQGVKGFVFACTNSSQNECLKRMLFGTNRQYGAMAIRVRRGDFLFLLNLSTDLLLGIFRSLSDGKLNINPNAWNGNYPYQVKVESLGDIVPIVNAKKLLKSMGISRSTVIKGKPVLNLISFFRP